MCGFAGIVGPDLGPDTESVVRRMTRTLTRRGPDGEGYLRLVNAALGHRRLAIVDPAGGQQPMTILGEDLALVANAEIYNHLDLRRDLEAKGARFRTKCDVEVILEGYRAWGPAVVERLFGMFAFALWDGRARRLLLARDRLGQKPLYYARDGETFLFASEAKAILAALPQRPSIEPEALARYLALDFVPTPWSIFQGIQKLPAAATLDLVADREPCVTHYWNLPAPMPDALAPADVDERIAELFDQALRRRLMSDVPIGLLLSGGLDSTLVGAALQRLGAPLETFSLGFQEPAFDESSAASAVARWLGTTHHSERFGVRALHASLPEVVDWLDEPFADPSLLAVNALSRFTREKVKVAIGGDGADELFGGYDVFLAAKLDHWTRGLGRLRPRLLARVGALLGQREQHFSWDFRFRQFAGGLDHDEMVRPLAYTLTNPTQDISGLLTRSLSTDVLAEARGANAPRVTHPLDRALHQYMRVFLESDILFKVDRAGMANGLEIRSPFLDHQLIEFVSALPGHVKVPSLSRKALLRRALARNVPGQFLRRPKQGFSLPIVEWINGELRGWFDEVLLDDAGYRDGLLSRVAVEKLLARHRSGQANLRKPIWNLAILMLWKARWLSTGATPIDA